MCLLCLSSFLLFSFGDDRFIYVVVVLAVLSCRFCFLHCDVLCDNYFGCVCLVAVVYYICVVLALAALCYCVCFVVFVFLCGSLCVCLLGGYVLFFCYFIICL